MITSNYNYDNNSNRIGATVRGETITATYNVQGRMLTYGGETFSANLNGDMTKISPTVNPTPETIEQLFYDPFGNLTSYRFFDGKIDDELKQRYIYNPEGRIVGELEGTNRLVKTFVYGSKSHVPDYYIDESGNKFRIITDHLGSVRLLVEATSGRVIKMMEHDEFGVVLQDTRPGFLPFGFAGGIYDQYTGLVRFGARDYSPYFGRWTAKDPIRFEGGDENLYGYVLNDPINWIDPKGESAWGVVGGGMIIGGAIVIGSSGVTVGGTIAGGCMIAAGIKMIKDDREAQLKKELEEQLKKKTKIKVRDFK